MAPCALLFISLLPLAQTDTASRVQGVDAPSWKQDRLYIGYYLDAPAGEDQEARLREIAEANFTVALIGNLRETDAALVQQKLDICAALGLPAVPMMRPGTPAASMPDGPACVAYGVWDEPGTDQFPQLAEIVKSYRTARPGKPAVINLFPSYASPWGQLGAATYEEYVARFVEVVRPEVLCMDHYPVFRPDEPDGRDGYCADLDVMRRHSLAQGIPFWNFLNVMPYGAHTDPTEDQLRWQVFASLTYGARGLMYFCYWTPAHRAPDGTFEFPKGGAVITADGRRTRHYEQVKRINLAARNLGSALMALTSTAVLRVGPDADPAALAAATPLKAITRAEADPASDYLVGAFRHVDGRRAVMVMNYRFAYTAWPTLEFDCDLSHVREVCQATGKEVPVVDDSPEMDGLQVSLDAGQGRLFLVSDVRRSDSQGG